MGGLLVHDLQLISVSIVLSLTDGALTNNDIFDIYLCILHRRPPAPAPRPNDEVGETVAVASSSMALGWPLTEWRPLPAPLVH